MRTDRTRMTLVRRRAVVLEAPKASRAFWLEACAKYAAEHRLDITVVARTMEAAVSAIAGGEADVLIAGRVEHLGELVQFAQGVPPRSAAADERRPVRLR